MGAIAALVEARVVAADRGVNNLARRRTIAAVNSRGVLLELAVPLPVGGCRRCAACAARAAQDVDGQAKARVHNILVLGRLRDGGAFHCRGATRLTCQLGQQTTQKKAGGRLPKTSERQGLARRCSQQQAAAAAAEAAEAAATETELAGA